MNVLNNGSHIKESPFVVMIDPAEEGKHTRPLSVNDLDGSKKARKGEPFEFSVHKDPGRILSAGMTTITASDAPEPEVVIYDPDLKKVDHRTQGAGLSRQYSFTPEKTGKHIVTIAEDKVAVKGSPFPVIPHMLRICIEVSHFRSMSKSRWTSLSFVFMDRALAVMW